MPDKQVEDLFIFKIIAKIKLTLKF